MRLDISGGKSQGARDYQEDHFEICSEASGDQDSCLLVLCDGMGGHTGGAIASRIATDAFVDSFLSAQKAHSADEALNTALYTAHQAILSAIANNAGPADMGTTLVATFIDKVSLHWISVGDSHLYLQRKGQLSKLNADHSMASVLDELAEIGRITPDEAHNDPLRNALRSSLSGEELTLVDQNSKVDFLQPDDTLLLASDGLDTLDTASISHLLAKSGRKGAEKTVEKLLAASEALDNPTQDNTTVIVATLMKDSVIANMLRSFG